MIINQPKKVFFSFHGRINRTTFWAYSIPMIAYQVFMNFADHDMVPFANNAFVSLIIALISLFLIWPNLALGVKRMHDRDKSGWWLLIGLIPLIGAIWLLVSLGFMKGTEGSNKFGEDPFVEYEKNRC